MTLIQEVRQHFVEDLDPRRRKLKPSDAQDQVTAQQSLRKVSSNQTNNRGKNRCVWATSKGPTYSRISARNIDRVLRSQNHSCGGSREAHSLVLKTILTGRFLKRLNVKATQKVQIFCFKT